MLELDKIFDQKKFEKVLADGDNEIDNIYSESLLEIYQKTLAANPSDIQTWEKIGDLCKLNKKYLEALNSYIHVWILSKNRYYDDIFIKIGQILLEHLDQKELGIKVLFNVCEGRTDIITQLLDYEPKNNILLTHFYNSLLENNLSMDEKVKILIQLIKLEPCEEYNWKDLAETLELYLPEDSFGAYMQAAKLNPFYFNKYLKIGEECIFRIYDKKELNILIELIKERPKDGILYKKLGAIYYNMHDSDLALKTLNFAAELLPNDYSIWDLIGNVYYYLKFDNSSSINAYLKAKSICEKDQIPNRFSEEIDYIKNESIIESLLEHILPPKYHEYIYLSYRDFL